MRETGYYWVKVNTPRCEWQPALFRSDGLWWVEEGRMEDAEDRELSVIGPRIFEPEGDAGKSGVYLIMQTGGMEPAWPVAYRLTEAAAADYCKILKADNPDENHFVMELAEDAYNAPTPPP